MAAELDFGLIFIFGDGDLRRITFFLALVTDTGVSDSSRSILIEGVTNLSTPEFLPLD